MTLLVIDKWRTVTDTVMHTYRGDFEVGVDYDTVKISTLPKPIIWDYIYDPDSPFHRQSLVSYTTMAFVGDYDVYLAFKEKLNVYTGWGLQQAAADTVEGLNAKAVHVPETQIYIPFPDGVIRVSLAGNGFYQVTLLKGEFFIAGAAAPPDHTNEGHPYWWYFLDAYRADRLLSLKYHQKLHNVDVIQENTFGFGTTEESTADDK